MLRSLARCHPITPRSRVLATQGSLVRAFQFASSRFDQALSEKLPSADRKQLKESALNYLAQFDLTRWSLEPIVTILRGQNIVDGKRVPTTNAFGQQNGIQVLATSETIDLVHSHITSFVPPTDLRQAVRRAEARIFSDDAGALIGNQNVDFGKQDGLTEIEEAIQANEVERRLNDMLFEDEYKELVVIDRTPAFVGCVSNFSNFLDLSRKVLRNIELGVPVVVLSRSNTTQHMFRWFQILVERLRQENVDLGMVTYLSCDIDQQRELFKKVPSCPLYFTGSRPIAKAIKELLPRTFASTGGPNTMLSVGAPTEKVLNAMRVSSAIENSGQCTALRHFVVGSATPEQIEQTLSRIPVVGSAKESLEKGEFAGLIKGSPFDLKPGYTRVADTAAAYRISSSLPDELDENWRQVYVDVTTIGDLNDDENLDKLANWLVVHQPISLAVNGENAPYPISLKLFEKTGLCVYTIGTESAPALTAQARPQDGEIFGELPPRQEMSMFTHLPMIVPSSTPAYNTHYSSVQLLSPPSLPKHLTFCAELVEAIGNEKKRGFAQLLLNYLADACGPRRGQGYRTSLYGLQRPPLSGLRTVIRVESDQDMDDLIVYVLPFLVTNARGQVVVSCHPDHPSLRSIVLRNNRLRGIPVVFETSASSQPTFNTLVPSLDMSAVPLASHFVSRFFCLGHVKSTAHDDSDFVDVFSRSAKWLSIMSG